MVQVIRAVNLYEVNDYVKTEHGVGIVVQVNEDTTTNIYTHHTVLVQHKFAYDGNSNNTMIQFSSIDVTLITEKEYEEYEECSI